MSRADFLNVYKPTFLQRISRGTKNCESYPELCSPAFYRELETFADDTELYLTIEDRALVEEIQRGHSLLGEGVGSFFSQEDMNYWSSPYAVEPGVTRRLGNGVVISAEDKKVREARERARREFWEKNLQARERDKEMAAAELAREQAAWETAEEQRLKRQREADRQWDQAEHERRERIRLETLERVRRELDEYHRKEKQAGDLRKTPERKTKAAKKRDYQPSPEFKFQPLVRPVSLLHSRDFTAQWDEITRSRPAWRAHVLMNERDAAVCRLIEIYANCSPLQTDNELKERIRQTLTAIPNVTIEQMGKIAQCDNGDLLISLGHELCRETAI